MEIDRRKLLLATAWSAVLNLVGPAFGPPRPPAQMNPRGTRLPYPFSTEPGKLAWSTGKPIGLYRTPHPTRSR